MPKTTRKRREISKAETELIFRDFESRQNLLGLYELAYRIDKRVNPELYVEPAQPINKDHD